MTTLTIGLDYDGTFTADPDLWRQFVSDCQRRGHSVICVTARREPPDFAREPRLPMGVPIVCAGQAFKRDAAAERTACAKLCMDKAHKMEREAVDAEDEDDGDTRDSNRATAWVLAVCSQEILARKDEP